MSPKFTIKNFKVFDNEGATFELAPITMLTGCNSSGKSSMVKAMMLFSDVMNNIKNDIVSWNRCELAKCKLNLSKMRYKLGKYDLVLNKDAKKDSDISFEYTFESQILGEDVSLTLSFKAVDGDDINDGWLSGLKISKANGACIFAVEVVDGDVKIKCLDVKCVRPNIIKYIETHEDGKDSALRKDLVARLTKGEPYCHLSIFNEIEDQGITNDKEKTIDFLVQRAKELQPSDTSNFNRCFKILTDSYRNSENVTLMDFFRSCEEEKYMHFLNGDSYSKCGDLFTRLLYFFYQYPESLGVSTTDEPICPEGLDANMSYSDISAVFFSDSFDLLSDEEQRYLRWLDELKYYTEAQHESVAAIEVLYMLPNSKEYKSRSESELARKIQISNYIDISPENACVYEFFKELILEVLTSLSDTVYVPSSRAVVQRLFNVDDKSNEFGALLQKYVDAKTKFDSYYDYEPDTFLNKWIRKFKLGNSLYFKNTEEGAGIAIYLYKDNKKSTKTLLADEGYGVTQLVSIMLQIETAIMEFKTKHLDWVRTANAQKIQKHEVKPIMIEPKPATIAIEEPEIHLHPRFQSKLADMFADAYEEYGIRFIVETHSEYLIRKLQTAVAKNTMNHGEGLPAKDISIYYLYSPNSSELPENEKQIKRIGINDDGCLNEPFGSGFFDEADNLSMDILMLKAGR